MTALAARGLEDRLGGTSLPGNHGHQERCSTAEPLGMSPCLIQDSPIGNMGSGPVSGTGRGFPRGRASMNPGRLTRPSIVVLAVVWAAVATAPALWAADCNTKKLFKNVTLFEVTGCLSSNAKNNRDETPMHLAVQHTASPEVLGEPVALGAAPNARAAPCRAPFDLMLDNPALSGTCALSWIEGGRRFSQPTIEAYEREEHVRAHSLLEDVVSRSPVEAQVAATNSYLGLVHLDGLGEDQRTCLVFFLFVNAAQSGFADAQYKVAVELFALALDGYQFDRIPAKILALALFIKSAAQGHEQAIAMRDVLQSVLTAQELVEAESFSLSFPYADVLRSIC